MPSDANGVHSLPNGYRAEDGDTIQPSQHNPPLEDLSAGLTERLMRSGVAPMTAPLKLFDGSAAAPGLAFNSDPSAGFYLENGKIKFTKTVTGVLPIGLGPLPWSRLTAPPGWVLCFGQTLSRTAYPDLWDVAQIEIAASNPLYNNGDGSTTFGILDMRGCVAAAWDALGGSGAGRLSVNFGARAGAQAVALQQSELPAFSPGFSGTPAVISVTSSFNNIITGSRSSNVGINNGVFGYDMLNAGTSFSGPIGSTGNYTPQGSISTLGNGFSHNNLQPTLVTGAILYAGA